MDTFKTLDTLDNLDTMDTLDSFTNLNIFDTLDIWKTSDILDTLDKMDNFDSFDISNEFDTLDTFDNFDLLDPFWLIRLNTIFYFLYFDCFQKIEKLNLTHLCTNFVLVFNTIAFRQRCCLNLIQSMIPRPGRPRARPPE